MYVCVSVYIDSHEDFHANTTDIEPQSDLCADNLKDDIL